MGSLLTVKQTLCYCDLLMAILFQAPVEAALANASMPPCVVRSSRANNDVRRLIPLFWDEEQDNLRSFTKMRHVCRVGMAARTVHVGSPASMLAYGARRP
jgi:hypothetical protein